MEAAQLQQRPPVIIYPRNDPRHRSKHQHLVFAHGSWFWLSFTHRRPWDIVAERRARNKTAKQSRKANR